MPDNEQRRRFESRLKLLTYRNARKQSYVINCVEARAQLHSSIQGSFPLKLYKIGTATEDRGFHRRLEDIERNRLYLPNPLQLNDPYDADPFVDSESLKESMAKSITPEGVASTNKILASFMTLKERDRFFQAQETYEHCFHEATQEMIDNCIENLPAHLDQFRRRMRIASLTEDVTSTTMWAHYGGEGNGLAAAYFFCSPDDLSLDNDEKTSAIITMCPVLYEGRYSLDKLAHVPFGSNSFIPYCTEATYLAFINTAVRKEANWSYEKEWRIVLIAPAELPNKTYLRLHVSELYVGDSLNKSNLTLVRSLGDRLGVPIFQMYADHSSLSSKLHFKQLA